MTMRELLEAAIKTVADRGVPYGGVEDNFTRIARYWNAHLVAADVVSPNEPGDGPLGPEDVAMMMILMKLARLNNAPDHLDSWIDIAGYAACGGSIKAKKLFP